MVLNKIIIKHIMIVTKITAPALQLVTIAAVSLNLKYVSNILSAATKKDASCAPVSLLTLSDYVLSST